VLDGFSTALDEIDALLDLRQTWSEETDAKIKGRAAQTDPKWKRFEKTIHAIHQQLAPAGAIVTADDKVMGRESKSHANWT
jgi:hypothetical protein